jgi:hypothetical protein
MTNILEAMKKNEEIYGIQMRQFRVHHKIFTKVAIGRRKKRTNWIIWSYAALHDEFD